MRTRYWLAVLMSVLIFMPVAQVAADDALPKSLSGRWIGTTVKRTPYDFAWSLQIAKQNPDGSFEGTINYDGRQCTARNAPMTGTFDGAELTIKTELEPKTQCGPTTFRLKKAGGKHLFEGKPRVGGGEGYLDPS